MIEARQIVADLQSATSERRARAPFTDEHPDLDVDTAYEAQWISVQARLDAGETLVGAKLGLTSRAKQKVMSVDNPLYGWVTSDMLFPAEDPVPLDRFIHPRVESEIAFLLGRDVETPATVTSVLAATEAVFGAVDILDSRYENFRFKLPDVVADNASAGGFILGPTTLGPTQVPDLRLVGCVVRVNGEVAATAAGAAVMGHPAASVAWLANKLAASKRRLQAGWLVFSGGLTEPFPLGPTGSVSFEFDGLGSIEVRGA